MNIEIRPMMQDDIPHLEQIVARIYPANKEIIGTLKMDLSDMFSTANIRPTFFVAVADDTVVGFAGIKEAIITFNAFQLCWLMVDPLFQKKGVGKKLTEHRHQELKNLGVRYAIIAVDDPTFASKFGYKEIDLVDGEHIMSLHL